MKSKIKEFLKENYMVIIIVATILTVLTFVLLNMSNNKAGYNYEYGYYGYYDDYYGGGNIGNTSNEIEEYFNAGNTTLYISNETQLRSLAEYVNAGNDCYGKTIILVNDIEVSSTKWVPIGDSYDFNGTFNGNAYKISGVTYVATKMNNNDILYIGLFGNIGRQGVIKNLKTANFNIDVSKITDEGEGDTYAGNIAGQVYGGSIVNCINDSNIIGANTISGTGGIVGILYSGRVLNCLNNGNVTGEDFVGGIAGRTYGSAWSIRECYNNGIINGNSYLGGIAGIAFGLSNTDSAYTSYLMDCINAGNVFSFNYNSDVTGDGENVGGIVGRAVDNTYIKRVTNWYGVITGKSAVGGIVGDIENTNLYNALNKYGEIRCYDGVYGGIAGIAGGVEFVCCGNYSVTYEGHAGDTGVCNYLYAADLGFTEENCFDQLTQSHGAVGENFLETENGYLFGTTLKSIDITNFEQPYLTIEAKNVSDSTNADTITYEFTWNGNVSGFTTEDIVVTKGTKGTLSSAVSNGDGTYSYTMNITTTIASGDKDIMTVRVPELAVCNTNVIYNRGTTQNTITIDRTAPKISKLEVTSPSNGTYEAGQEVIIKATISEAITGAAPTLNLQFGGKNIVNYDKKEATVGTDSITWKFTIAEGDNGKLTAVSLEGGTIKDAVGNSLDLTLPTLQGEITADTTPSEIKFNDLETKTINGKNYVIVSIGMTEKEIIADMDTDALDEKTPEFIQLTADNKLKTGSIIKLDGEEKYTIVISGDVNSDGDVTFNDIIRANAARIDSQGSSLPVEQLIAADINNGGTIDFQDIIKINSIRINISDN